MSYSYLSFIDSFFSDIYQDRSTTTLLASFSSIALLFLSSIFLLILCADSKSTVGATTERNKKSSDSQFTPEYEHDNDILPTSTSYDHFEALSALDIIRPDSSSIKIEGNKLTNTGSASESCLIGPVRSTGVHKITFTVPDNSTAEISLALANNGLPPEGQSFASAGKGISVLVSEGCVTNITHSPVGYVKPLTSSGTISLEVDLRHGEKEKRVLRFYVNDALQKVVMASIPDTVQFGLTLPDGESVEFSSLTTLPAPPPPSNPNIEFRRIQWSDGKAEKTTAGYGEVETSENSIETFPYTFSEKVNFKVDGGFVTHVTRNSVETILFTKKLEKGLYRLTFAVNKISANIWCGVINSACPIPPSGSHPSDNHSGVDFNLNYGLAYNSGNQKVGSIDTPKATDLVSLEVDLRSSTPAERTLHLFVRDIQQKYFFINLPASVQFAVSLWAMNDSIEFISFEDLSEPTRQPKGDEVGQPFDPDVS